MNHSKYIISALTLIAVCGAKFELKAQSFVADKVVAVVGSSAILYSDIVKQADEITLERREMNYTPDRSAENEALETLLLQKLLYNQAQIDSIDISYAMGQISSYAEDMVNQLILQAGSLQKYEAQEGRRAFEIKDEIIERLSEYQYAQDMMATVTRDITVTPGEVERHFRKLKKEELPIIPEQYVYAQITRFPKSSEGAKQRTKERLLEIRERILNGARFDMMARMYSVDPGSAFKGGELPPMTKNQFDPAFGEALAKLRPGQISGIVESTYGLHIIQLIRMEGESYVARHILLKPIFSDDELQETLTTLDSIANLIRNGEMTFAEAALRESDDAGSRLNGGLVTNIDAMKMNRMSNPEAATTRFFKDQVAPADYKELAKLKIGEISPAILSFNAKGDQMGKILSPVEIIPSHRADMSTDYLVMEQLALEEKKQKYFDEWLDRKIQTMYIRIDPSFDTSQFERSAWSQKQQ
ncbi:MAG: peptidylprolyl isomerase [Rikenellaceae bacterium]|nr:peptidylprolyl isomerase [Rikenellaceae bacterium]